MRLILKLFTASCVCALACSVVSTASAQAPAAPAAPRAVRKPAPAAPKVDAPVAASKPDQGLTNADVLQMIAAKLSEDIILNTIEDATKKAFDLSALGLVALKNGGVSDQIIRVMQGRPRTPNPVPAPAPAPVAAAPAAPIAPAADVPKGAAVNTPKAATVNTDEKKSGGVGRLLGTGLIGKLRSKDGDDVSQGSKAKELKNGETAVIQTELSTADATARVKAYLNSRDLDFTVNADTGRLLTDWFADRRCGPGIQHCANRANIRVAAEQGQTSIRIQVMERKREGGVSEKPWHENSESRGKETAQLAGEIEAFLRTAK